MKNKKVLELCLSPDLGGLEIYVHKCSLALEAFFYVLPVVSKGSKLELRFSETSGIQAPLVLKVANRFSLTAAYRLAKIIDKQQIDILHFHWNKDMPIAVLAKVFSKQKPKLVQTRHMTMTRYKNDPFHRYMYKNIDFILCVTQAVAEQITNFVPENIRPAITVLYPGADKVPIMQPSQLEALRKELGCKEDTFMLGLVGRINPAKGQHLLIEAVRLLSEKNIAIKAFIVGGAMREDYLNELRNKVKSYDLQDDIIFYGFTNKPNEFMQVCDVMLTTSKNETFGLVTVEAMQCGTAVIAANKGGPLEIIDDGKTGMLFQSGNAQDLADKIEVLYKDKNKRRLLAEAGKNKASQLFENEKHFQQLALIFNKF